jgi:O-methyltransferase
MVQRSQARAPAPFAKLRTLGALLKNTPLDWPARRTYRALETAESYLRSKGILVRPLVPERELLACQKQAIQYLQRNPDREWGDYLEFGVCQGQSMSLMYRALSEANLLAKVRLYGFDSFEGYPIEAADEPNLFVPGGDKAEIHVAQRLLTQRGVDWTRVKLVKGWFKDTLTEEFKQSQNINRVSLVNFDCDLYSSTAQALQFAAPLVRHDAIFFFDDWGDKDQMEGQQKAFVEYLIANTDIHAEELPNYSWESRVFYISRGASEARWQARVVS